MEFLHRRIRRAEAGLSVAMTKHLTDTFSLEKWFIVAQGCFEGFGHWSGLCFWGCSEAGHHGRREPRKVLVHSSQEAESVNLFWLLLSLPFIPPGPQIKVSPPS